LCVCHVAFAWMSGHRMRRCCLLGRAIRIKYQYAVEGKGDICVCVDAARQCVWTVACLPRRNSFLHGCRATGVYDEVLARDTGLVLCAGEPAQFEKWAMSFAKFSAP